jgi:hypothetical protein
MISFRQARPNMDGRCSCDSNMEVHKRRRRCMVLFVFLLFVKSRKHPPSGIILTHNFGGNYAQIAETIPNEMK